MVTISIWPRVVLCLMLALSMGTRGFKSLSWSCFYLSSWPCPFSWCFTSETVFVAVIHCYFNEDLLACWSQGRKGNSLILGLSLSLWSASWVCVLGVWSSQCFWPFPGYCVLNCIPPKDMLKFSPLIPVNETSFGNSISEDNQDRMRSYWIGVGLQSTEDALIRREKLEHTEETQ